MSGSSQGIGRKQAERTFGAEERTLEHLHQHDRSQMASINAPFVPQEIHRRDALGYWEKKRNQEERAEYMHFEEVITSKNESTAAPSKDVLPPNSPTAEARNKQGYTGQASFSSRHSSNDASSGPSKQVPKALCCEKRLDRSLQPDIKSLAANSPIEGRATRLSPRATLPPIAPPSSLGTEVRPVGSQDFAPLSPVVGHQNSSSGKSVAPSVAPYPLYLPMSLSTHFMQPPISMPAEGPRTDLNLALNQYIVRPGLGEASPSNIAHYSQPPRSGLRVQAPTFMPLDTRIPHRPEEEPISVPVFDGCDPNQWIMWRNMLEAKFESDPWRFNNDDMKLQYIIAHLRGFPQSLVWPPKTFADANELLSELEQFILADPHERQVRATQYLRDPSSAMAPHETFDDFIRRFMTAASCISTITDQGLKVYVRQMLPRRLRLAMDDGREYNRFDEFVWACRAAEAALLVPYA